MPRILLIVTVLVTLSAVGAILAAAGPATHVSVQTG